MKIDNTQSLIFALEITFFFICNFGSILVFLISRNSGYRFLSLGLLTASAFFYQQLFDIRSDLILDLLIFVNLLAWPSFYKFVAFITFKELKLTLKDFKHFLWYPAYIITGLLFKEPDYLLFFRFFQMVLYSSIMFKNIYSYEKRIEHYYSDIESRKYNFLKICIILLIIPWIAGSVSQFLSLLTGGVFWHGNFIVSLAKNSFNVISFSLITIFAVLKKDFFEKSYEIEEQTNLTGPSRPDNNDVELANKLDEIMDSKNIYLDPELSLTSLSKIAGVNKNKLSSILNNVKGCTFFEYVNSFRIKDVKNKLSDPLLSEKTILEIAFSSGFKSKTTFNTLFKKETGKTPTEFRVSVISNN